MALLHLVYVRRREAKEGERRSEERPWVQGLAFSRVMQQGQPDDEEEELGASGKAKPVSGLGI